LLHFECLTVNAFQAELAWRHGQLDRATHLAAQIEATFQSKTMPYPYQPQMVLPKIWLAEGTPESCHRTETELLRLQEIVTSTHNVRYQIEVLALQALLYRAQSKPQAADAALTQALRLAQPSRMIRVFVDLGPDMALLLKRLYTQGIAPFYLQQILEAFPVTKPNTQIMSPQALVEPLTEREMEVLALLAQRLSNNEIANMLVISPETVKRHTINIYQKLGVNKRRQAVATGYKLGLLADMV
jgi:LuxR family maltose regulon positive regulatory protein